MVNWFVQTVRIFFYSNYVFQPYRYISQDISKILNLKGSKDQNKKLGNKYSYVLAGHAHQPVKNTELCSHNAPAYG